MKKTYWWRMLILFLGLIFVMVDYFTYCEMSIRRCFWSGDVYILRTMFHFTIPVLFVSIITFFLSDNLFKKWFIFGIVWFFISLFFISITPEYGVGFLDPDREQVSIWMSSLFLIISLILIIIWSIKEKNLIKLKK